MRYQLLLVNVAAVATAFNTQDIARRLPLLTKMAEVTNPLHAAAAVMDVADDEISISCQPAKDLQGTDLQYSVFTKETRGAHYRNQRVCMFCGHKWKCSPCGVNAHLRCEGAKKDVKECKPKDVELEARMQEVKAEIEKRLAEDNKHKGRGAQQTAARESTQSGEAFLRSIYKIPTKDEIVEQLARVCADMNIGPSLVENGEWRKLMAMQAHRGKLGLKRNSADHPERSAETRNTPFVIDLPRSRNTLKKAILEVDQKVAKGLGVKTLAQAEMFGCIGNGDGWKDAHGKPLLNFCQVVPGGMRFIKCVDTSGHTKDADFQASFVMECMDESGGAHLYWILFFDGACKPSFELIESKAQHVSVIIDPAHSIDNFAKNVCSNAPKITIKDKGSYDWGVDLFHDVTVDVWTVVKAIYAQERPLHIYRKLAKERAEQPAGGPEMLKFCLTRYLSRIMMVGRYKSNLDVVDALLSNLEFTQWLAGQKRDVKERWEKVRKIVRAEGHGQKVDLFLTVLAPVCKLVRLCDNTKGAVLGTVYEALLSYSNSIEVGGTQIPGLDDATRQKIHTLLMKRWDYFHNAAFTAAFMLHPAYCQNEFSKKQEGELRAFLRKVLTPYEGYTPPYTYSQVLSELTQFRNAVRAKSGDFTDELAFADDALDAMPYEWWQTWGFDFQALQFVAIRLGAASIGSSTAETDWSIRGWMSRGRYASRSMKLVNAMVRLHHNIKLEHVLAQLETGSTYWDIDMSIPEPPPEIPRRTLLETGAGRVASDDEDEDLFGDPAQDLADVSENWVEDDDDVPEARPGRARDEEEEQVEEEEARPRRRARTRG